jgi:hypothetical protein
VRGEGSNDPQVAITLREVQAVADDELVGDIETDIADVYWGLGGLAFAQKGEDLH